MGYWRTVHLFDDQKFYKEVVPALKGEAGDLTKDLLTFFQNYVSGGIRNLSPKETDHLISQTLNRFISISHTLDASFKINKEFENIKTIDGLMSFMNGLDGYYEFCDFFEYYLFQTCSDFFPHVAVRKNRLGMQFDLNVKTLAYSLISELDAGCFFSGSGMGVESWITNEDVQYLYLDKSNLHFNDNIIAEGFLTLLEVAHAHQLGMLIGIDINERHSNLPSTSKSIKLGSWVNESLIGLSWGY